MTKGSTFPGELCLLFPESVINSQPVIKETPSLDILVILFTFRILFGVDFFYS